MVSQKHNLPFAPAVWGPLAFSCHKRRVLSECLDQNIDCISVISCRRDFLQFVLNNRALVSCQPMGDGLWEFGALIGCGPPEMTYTPLSLSQILREIEFISIHVKMTLRLNLSNSYETWQYTVQPITSTMFIQFPLRIYFMELITTK